MADAAYGGGLTSSANSSDRRDGAAAASWLFAPASRRVDHLRGDFNAFLATSAVPPADANASASGPSTGTASGQHASQTSSAEPTNSSSGNPEDEEPTTETAAAQVPTLVAEKVALPADVSNEHDVENHFVPDLEHADSDSDDHPEGTRQRSASSREASSAANHGKAEAVTGKELPSQEAVPESQAAATSEQVPAVAEPAPAPEMAGSESHITEPISTNQSAVPEKALPKTAVTTGAHDQAGAPVVRAATPSDSTAQVAGQQVTEQHASPTSRRGANQAGRTREPQKGRQAANPAAASDRAGATASSAQPQVQPAVGDVAMAAATPASAAAAPAPPGTQAAAAAVPLASAAAGAAVGEAISAAPTGAVSAGPTAVSPPGSGDQLADRAPAAAPPDRTDIADRARLVHRISKAFAKLGADGGQVRMRMHPEALGSVLLEMRVQGRSVEARVTAANEVSLDLLRQQLPELRQRLENQGMTVQRLDVELREDAGGEGQGFGDGPGGDRWGSSSPHQDGGTHHGPRQQGARGQGRPAATIETALAPIGPRLIAVTDPAVPGTLDVQL